jgi:hypothetical protein
MLRLACVEILARAEPTQATAPYDKGNNPLSSKPCYYG